MNELTISVKIEFRNDMGGITTLEETFKDAESAIAWLDVNTEPSDKREGEE